MGSGLSTKDGKQPRSAPPSAKTPKAVSPLTFPTRRGRSTTACCWDTQTFSQPLP